MGETSKTRKGEKVEGREEGMDGEGGWMDGVGWLVCHLFLA